MFFIQPERNLTDHAEGGDLPILYVGLDVFYKNRIDVVDRFGRFCNSITDSIIYAFFRRGNELNYFYY